MATLQRSLSVEARDLRSGLWNKRAAAVLPLNESRARLTWVGLRRKNSLLLFALGGCEPWKSRLISLFIPLERKSKVMSSGRPSQDKNSGGTVRQMALPFELPFILVGPVVLGGAVGYFLDRWLHTKPLLLIVLGIMGVAVGVREAVEGATALDKKP